MIFVAGLDLSLSSTGICWTGPTGSPEVALVTSSPSTNLWNRLEHIASAVLIPNQTHYVIEDLPHGVAHSGTVLGMVHGAVYSHFPKGVSVTFVPPASLKKYATNNGRATKREMVQAAKDNFGFVKIRGDEADAAWLWHIGMDMLGTPLVDVGPRRSLLKKLEWSKVE